MADGRHLGFVKMLICQNVERRHFGVDQHFCAKFVTVMENRQRKGSQCSEIRFLAAILDFDFGP